MIPPLDAFRGMLIGFGREVFLKDLPGFPARLRRIFCSFTCVLTPFECRCQYTGKHQVDYLSVRVAWILFCVYTFFVCGLRGRDLLLLGFELAGGFKYLKPGD